MTEAELCAGFIASATKPSHVHAPTWTAYAETEGFDILLVRNDGVQIGIEAKLALNAKVVAQALPYRESWYYGSSAGPDYRAVLVPAGKCNADLSRACAALGITVIRYSVPRDGERYSWRQDFTPYLPCDKSGTATDDWFPWAPVSCCPVPEYVPDVQAGCSAPVALTQWKIKAIRLAVLLEERAVTRADFKALQLSPTNWLCPRGWLDRTENGWVRGERTPDFARQHPTNYAQIRADKARWEPSFSARLVL